MTIDDLVTTLERAEGFDRDADLAIGRLILGWHVVGTVVQTHTGDVYPKHPGSLYPTFTELFDTALEMMQIALPGWYWRAGNVPAGHYERGRLWHGWAHVSKTDASNCDRNDEFTGWAETPTLALCLAVVKAKKVLG